MKQRDLFGKQTRVSQPAAKREPYVIEPFDDWDEARMVPQLDAPILDECLIADLGEK